MAASRGKKTPARKPKKAIEREEEADEEEEEEDDEVVKTLASFNPETHALYCFITHTCLTNEAHAELLSSKNALDDRAAALIEGDAKRSETMFMGFQANAGIHQEQLQRAYEFGNMQRDEAERQRARVSQVEMELSRMIRQSEDAKLERDRLSADIQRGQMSLQRLEAELDAKVRQRQAELEAVKQVSAPVFAVAGQGLAALIAQYGANKIPGLAAAGNAAVAAANQPQPNGANGANGKSNGKPVAEVDLNLDDTEAFKKAFLDVFNTLGPRSLACLRALVCSNALPGAPPVPAVVGEVLLGCIMEDAGQENVMALLRAAGQAYVSEPPASPAADGAAAQPPPGGAPN